MSDDTRPLPVKAPSPVDTSAGEDPLRHLFSAAATPDPDSTLPTRPAPPADVPTIPGYAITAELARGGMGRVYTGRELALDREVAIKTLLPGANAVRFVTESKITAKLPHPNIPPVHALGTLPDGSPFLAMKLVRGRTLSELLKARPSPAHDLPRWVQVFEGICQAVGFAHAQGVIHRDLKPLNVMVGEFGEVQVMDWGLAREMRNAEVGVRNDEDHPDDVPFTPHSALPTPHLTQAGTVLGTPGYMAPEQARGEPADARADVFALGSVLATVLTGRPAFVGNTAMETIAKAAAGDLADVFDRLDACGADADLIALAKRCLAADRDARPPDGRAVASEVGAYRAGVEARLRQAETDRAAAVVREAEQRKRRRVQGAAIAFLALGVVGTGIGLLVALDRVKKEERAKVEEQTARAAAEVAEEETLAAYRASTDEAIEQLIGSKPQLGPQERAYLEGARQRWQAFADRAGNDERSRAVRGEGHYRVGMTWEMLGRRAEAEAELRRALLARLPLVAEFPTVIRYRRDLVLTHRDLGMVLNQLGRRMEAEDQAAEAVRLADELTADEPSVPEHQFDSADSHHTLGTILEAQGRYSAAISHYSSALGILTRMEAEHSESPRVLKLTAMVHHNLGAAFGNSGDPDRLKAEEQLHLALALQKRLVAAHPAVPFFRRTLAMFHFNLGTEEWEDGHRAEAAGQLRASLAEWEKLAADFPAVNTYRYELSLGLNLYGVLMGEMGERTTSEKLLNRAIATVEQLIQTDENAADYHRLLGDVLTNRSAVRAGAGSVFAAAQDLTRAGQEKAIAMRLDPVGTERDARVQWERIKGLTPGAKKGAADPPKKGK